MKNYKLGNMINDQRVCELKDYVFEYACDDLEEKDYKFDLQLFKHEFPQCFIEEIVQALLNERSLFSKSAAI